MEQVELFYNRSMRHHTCIGVHVRFAEIHERETPAGHPSFYEYWVEIDSLLQKYADRQVTIFLATDSTAVITDFKKRYGKRLIYIDTYRAQQREDPSLIYESPSYWMSHVAEWHKKKPGYRGGVGALMDCLLLSKCDYLIHTTSNVATFASFFNPYIKSIYIPRDVPFSHCRFRGDSTIRNKYLNPI